MQRPLFKDSKTDGSGFDQSDQEVRESRDALRGRRGHSDINPGYDNVLVIATPPTTLIGSMRSLDA